MARQSVAHPRRKKSPGIAAALCSVLLVSCLTAHSQAAPRPTRVLFIGNSYTYFNNAPEIFRKLTESGKRAVEVQMVAPGGFRLKDHWEKGDALKTLREGRWDYVVLQDQSMLGVTHWVEGKVHVSSNEIFLPYAEKWATEIRKAGAIPVFFLTWAGKDTPEDQPALNYFYTRAARETQSRVAPVGIAWEQVRRKIPTLGLFYVGHGSHPSAAGSYLAACVFYATIFRSSPVGLPGRIEGHPVNLDTEKVETEKTAVLADLTADASTALQTAAWDAFEQERRNGGYPSVQPAPTPTVQPLPTAMPLSLQALDGDWMGKILFYPAGAVDMILEFHHAADWSLRLGLQYHSKDFVDESLKVDDLRVGDREFTFSDPKSAGVEDLPVRFRAVLGQDGKLHGTAESISNKDEPPIRLIGDWVLEKR